MTQHDQDLEQDIIEEMDDDFAVDAVLNELAMDTLTYVNEKVAADPRVPEDEQAFFMWQAMTAVLFNVIMHISENAGVDPLELIAKTKDNLTEAVEGMSAGCCGGDHHHHHH